MASCELCGKHTNFGNKVKKIRAGLYSRTSRQFKPNLQHVTIKLNGNAKRVFACTRCIRTVNRDNRANRIRQ